MTAIEEAELTGLVEQLVLKNKDSIIHWGKTQETKQERKHVNMFEVLAPGMWHLQLHSEKTKGYKLIEHMNH